MEAANTHITYHLETSLIHADETFNCRGEIQAYNLVDLASSIKDHGLQIPVIVWETTGLPNGCKFLLIAGYRRFTACTTLLKQTTILATVRTDLTEETARVLNFTENLERKNLNILEEAKAIAIAFPEKMAMLAIGRKLNRGFMWVKIRRMLLELPEIAQNAAAVGLFTIEDIKLVHSTNTFYRLELSKRIIEARKEGTVIDTFSTKQKKSVHHYVKKPKLDEIQDLMGYLIENGLAGLPTKLLLYILGRMTAEDLYKYIDSLKNRLTEPRIRRILDKKDAMHENQKNVSERKGTRGSKARRSNRNS